MFPPEWNDYRVRGRSAAQAPKLDQRRFCPITIKKNIRRESSNNAVKDVTKEESGLRGLGFGSTPGKGRFVTKLISTINWSVGVLEYWKTEHMTNICQESNLRLTGFSSFGAQEPQTITPILHHSLVFSRQSLLILTWLRDRDLILE